jgi:head-tail adaptor
MAFKLAGPLNVPLVLLIPSTSNSYGVLQKAFPDPSKGEQIFGTFRTFGGTETTSNGVYSVENTATIETWYRADIKSDCRIYVPQTGDTYEIVGTPENIEMRNQYLSIRVQMVKGGA